MAIWVDKVLFPLTESHYVINSKKDKEAIIDAFIEAEKGNKKPRACLIYSADFSDKAQKARPLNDWEKNSGFYKIGTFVEFSAFRLVPETGALSVKTAALRTCEIKSVSPLGGAAAAEGAIFECEAEIIPLRPPLFVKDESKIIYEWELGIFRNLIIGLSRDLEKARGMNPAALADKPLLSFFAGVDLLDVNSIRKVEKTVYEFFDMNYPGAFARRIILESPPHQRLIFANEAVGELIKILIERFSAGEEADPDSIPMLPPGAQPGQNGQNRRNGHSETAEIKDKFEKKKQNLPDEVQKIVLRYLKMVEGRQDSEAKKYIEYLHFILDYPFGVFAKDRENFRETAEILNKSHYGLDKVKEEVLEFLAARKLNPQVKGSILCLIGPAGVGKTSIGKSIAEALGRPFVGIKLGGVRDEAAIRGHSFTYVGSKPGRIVEHIRRCGVSNPVFIIDEIDKIGQASAQGSVEAALLEVLDPEQNDKFEEHYLGVPVDLSQVLFIATGNVLEEISGPLRDRMRVIRIPGYAIPEQVEIAKGYLIPRQMGRNGLEGRIQVEFSDEILKFLIENYTYSPGVRTAEQKIETVLRKIGKKLVFGEKLPELIALTEQDIVGYLGKKKRIEKVRPTETGEAIGLAVTGEGRGNILFVQAELVPMGGRVEKPFSHTGNLMKVIEESEKVALSLVRKIMQEKKKIVGGDLLGGNLLHIHMPDGATPKDGPSAGITFVIALYSLLAEQPVKENLAMTGEVDLKGNVGAVGGIKEKMLAAVRAGAREVILSEENKDDFEELSDEVKRKIKPHFVKKVGEAIKIAFEN